MVGFGLPESFLRCAKQYNLTEEVECKVAIFPLAIKWNRLAFQSGNHVQDVSERIQPSLGYKTIRECLGDEFLSAPWWHEFYLTPSGKYAVAHDPHRVVAIKLPLRCEPTKEDLKRFVFFKETIRYSREKLRKQIPSFKRTIKENKKKDCEV